LEVGVGERGPLRDSAIRKSLILIKQPEVAATVGSDPSNKAAGEVNSEMIARDENDSAVDRNAELLLLA
jgi:hypothetical protein